MTEAQKLEIAQQLSKEYGMEGRKKTEESHFDINTGTLFIGSRVYRAAEIQKAGEFMKASMARMDEKNDASSSYYEIAVLAIERLLKESMGVGGRIVVKDSGEVVV